MNRLIKPQIPLHALIARRVSRSQADKVWTAKDFLDLGSRSAVDKTLQRLTNKGDLRRINHGLYDRPRVNPLTGKLNQPNYQHVIWAIARRDSARMLIDGMTAANDLGLTTAVPGKVIIHTDARIKPIQIGNLTIQFKLASPSKLIWADRPAMRVVQALHWLKDAIKQNDLAAVSDIRDTLSKVFNDPKAGALIQNDLKKNFSHLPAWMHPLLQNLTNYASHTQLAH
jgi:predicted transcriptional regulator of viral defense system